MTNLIYLDGNTRSIPPEHIYEVHHADGAIVDVLRFHTPEEARQFERGIVGDFYIRPRTLPADELLELVLDLRYIDLDEEEK